MIEFLKISLISTIITVAAACVMFYFTRYDFNFREIYNEGIDLYRQKKFGEALNRFQLAISKFPDKAEAYYNAGLCELRLKHNEKAKNYFSETLKLTPDDADARYNLGYIELYEGNYANAKAHFEAIKDKMSGESDFLFNLGIIEIKNENYEDAKKYIKQALEISPEKSIYKKYYQDVLEKLFELSGDMQIMQEILDLSLELLIVYPDDEDVIYRAAVAYAQMGDWGNSINYCERLYNINPNSHKACSQYGLALYCKGDMEEAIEMYEKAITVAPDIPDNYMNLVFAYDKIGDSENSIELAREFINKFPNDQGIELAKDFIQRKGSRL